MKQKLVQFWLSNNMGHLTKRDKLSFCEGWSQVWYDRKIYLVIAITFDSHDSLEKSFSWHDIHSIFRWKDMLIFSKTTQVVTKWCGLPLYWLGCGQLRWIRQTLPSYERSGLSILSCYQDECWHIGTMSMLFFWRLKTILVMWYVEYLRISDLRS